MEEETVKKKRNRRAFREVQPDNRPVVGSVITGDNRPVLRSSTCSIRRCLPRSAFTFAKTLEFKETISKRACFFFSFFFLTAVVSPRWPLFLVSQKVVGNGFTPLFTSFNESKARRKPRFAIGPDGPNVVVASCHYEDFRNRRSHKQTVSRASIGNLKMQNGRGRT